MSITERINGLIQDHLKNKSFLIGLFCLSFIYILPLLISNIPYDADSHRVLTGNFAYSNDARHFADLVFNFITPGSCAISLFPYTIITASLITSFAGYLVAFYFFPNIKGWSRYILSLSLLINPFYLSNLAFHFDSLPMSISILLAILALVIDRNSKSIKTYIFSIISLFLALSSYQSSLNVYLMLGIFILLSNDVDKRQLIRFFSRTFIACITYFLFAKLTIKQGYQIWRSSLINLDSSFISHVIENYYDGISRIGILFDSKYGIILFLIYTLFIFLFIYTQVKTRKLTKILINIIALLISFFFIYGFHSFFENPPFYARNYMAFGAFNLIVIFYISYSNKLQKIKPALLSLLVIYSFGVCSTFSNVRKFQHDYIRILSTKLAIDLSNLDLKTDKTHIAFSGKFPASNEYKNAIKSLPLLKMLVQKRLINFWPSYEDFKRYAPNSKSISPKEINIEGLNPQISRESYMIYKVKDKVLVDFI